MSALPAIAATGVLALSIAGVLLVRGGGPRAAQSEDPAPPVFVRVDVITLPGEATASHGGKLDGETPLTLQVRPGDRFVLELAKPGYRPRHVEVVVGASDQVVREDLEAERGYEGVWRLPDGDSISVHRNGQAVAVWRLGRWTTAGAGTHTYELARGDRIAFGGTEEQIDPRSPEDASCRIPVRVEYQYDAAADALAIVRERAVVQLRGHRCVITAREPEAPIALARVPAVQEPGLR